MMKAGQTMIIVRLVSGFAWLCVCFFTCHAIAWLGVSGIGELFLSDFSHPWKAQFNADFGLHLIAMAGCVAWRATGFLTKIGFGLACTFLGGLFSFAYIFIATFYARGHLPTLLCALPTNKGITR